MEQFAKILEQLRRLLEVLIQSFGVRGTLILVIAFVVLSIVYRVYRDRRQDRYIKALLEDKDRQIQRLAEQERNYRIHFFKLSGWTDAEIDQFVMKNEFSDVPSARRALQGEEPSVKTGELAQPEKPKKGNKPATARRHR